MRCVTANDFPVLFSILNYVSDVRKVATTTPVNKKRAQPENRLTRPILGVSQRVMDMMTDKPLTKYEVPAARKLSQEELDAQIASVMSHGKRTKKIESVRVDKPLKKVIKTVDRFEDLKGSSQAVISPIYLRKDDNAVETATTSDITSNVVNVDDNDISSKTQPVSIQTEQLRKR